VSFLGFDFGVFLPLGGLPSPSSEAPPALWF